MTVEQPTPQTPAASDAVARRTMGERRRRVVRSVLTVVVVTLLLLFLSILNRDQQAIEGCRERMEYMVKVFQEHRDKGLRSPSELPMSSQDRGHRDEYVYNWLYTESYRPKVGVCCCRVPHTRLFQLPRRYVIVFDSKERKYRLEWMKETEFAARAAELGLRVSVRP